MNHNCYVTTDGLRAEVRLPSVAAELHRAHKERLNRFKQAAAKAIAIRVDMADEGQVAILNASWADRQREIPLPKPDWFSILGEVTIKPRVSVEDIQHATATSFGTSRRALMSHDRHHGVVYPRQIAMFLSKTMTSRSYPEIGRRFGGRDHATVIHSFRKIEGLIQTDQRVADDVARVKALL